ncbi:MAG: 3-phosphoshikimate 1-carboxyvinyltransferase [Pseudomonadales bacterium]|jgi:3-phosphoshikimate 1-carboxyvinyltransferase|nr:3-phosphoshikimate 1-carboxyvinyltransferase [Pseudomonadales bacterium]MDP7357985.1 3-phosphoshikimate 1-carboxyvinyltransferase [Pseudomonadales bacterium]MDP7595369.1 3-phosphoshikimate 1-carboxyvinyltransferase [Pseudomonadales bacterium]HJN51932.1 3-phosphoshikimate 1-carboxyvinyltransferase [Pseudomonadales bacterium]
MNSLTLHPIESVNGEIYLPGSKSVSNRVLLLSALAAGTTEITNLLASDDTARMVQALLDLGTALQLSTDGQTCEVTGHGDCFPPQGRVALFLGNAGTAIRPLCATLCLSQGEFELSGDEHMQARPIYHLVDALKQLGAAIEYTAKPGYPPVKVTGTGLQGGDISIPGDISSQFLTSLLLALPLARGDSNIQVIGEQVSKPYLDITLDVMRRFGVNARQKDYQQFTVPGDQTYRSPGSFMVEGDASSATYFLAAAAIKGGTVRVHGIGTDSVQGDTRFVDVLERMGARVVRSRQWIEVSRGELNAIDMDLNHIPDAAMTIATAALFATGTTCIRNIYNWRVKETDRLHAMSTELRKLGAVVTEGEDSIQITPPKQIRKSAIDTYDDHRIAMAFSLAALGSQPIVINNPECTAKTFPNFFSEFAKICRSAEG